MNLRTIKNRLNLNRTLSPMGKENDYTFVDQLINDYNTIVLKSQHIKNELDKLEGHLSVYKDWGHGFHQATIDDFEERVTFLNRDARETYKKLLKIDKQLRYYLDNNPQLTLADNPDGTLVLLSARNHSFGKSLTDPTQNAPTIAPLEPSGPGYIGPFKVREGEWLPPISTDYTYQLLKLGNPPTSFLPRHPPKTTKYSNSYFYHSDDEHYIPPPSYPKPAKQGKFHKVKTFLHDAINWVSVFNPNENESTLFANVEPKSMSVNHASLFTPQPILPSDGELGGSAEHALESEGLSQFSMSHA